MLNKKDPLIDAIQQVMQSNQADRDAVKAVNEKFGIQDRRVLPRERQAEWDAAYKTVLTEGVESLDEISANLVARAAKKAERKADAATDDNLHVQAKAYDDQAERLWNKAEEKREKERRKKDIAGLSSGKKRAYQKRYGKLKEESLDEKLVGNQRKIDANKNGRVDGGDFRLLKKGVRPMIPMAEAKKMKGNDPCWKDYEMIGMKKKGGKPVPNCVPVKEEGDPSKAIPGDTVTGSSSVTPVPKPKSTSVTPEQQNALTNKIKSIKEAKKASMCEDTLQEKAPPGREDQVKALKKKFPKGSGSPFAIAWSSYKKKKKIDEAMAPSISRADAVTQGRQKQQADAVSSSVQKQNAIQRTNVGSGALTGGSLGNNSGSGTTAVSGPASRLSRISSSSVAGDARGGARPGPLPPKSPMSGQGSASPSPKSPMSGQGSASPSPKSPMSGQGSASPSPKSPMSGQGSALPSPKSPMAGQGAPGVRSQPGGARPGVVAKNSSTGAQSSTGMQVGGARPDAVAKNSPTVKAPVPTAKPADNATEKMKPVRKQPNTGIKKNPGVPAKPVTKGSILDRVKRNRMRDKNNEVGPGNS